MRLKMTREQHESLFLFLQNKVLKGIPENVGEALLLEFMNDLYERMRKKEKARLVRDWSLTLSDKEEMAYIMYWQGFPFNSTCLYEKLLVESHISLIVKFISVTPTNHLKPNKQHWINNTYNTQKSIS